MKLNIFIATIASALALGVASAGTSWCHSSSGKGCKTDCCPDIGAQVSVGYDTDYVFKGVRLARDVVWGDVNYTFENLPFTPNVGIWHLSSLGSATAGFPFATGPGNDAYGDETNFYAGISLPSVLGFDASLGYTYFLFPTSRGPQGNGGDSLSQISLSVGRELFGGVSFAYTADYLFGATAFANPFSNGRADSVGGFMHTFELAKSFCITDCINLDLSGGAYYNDNYYSQGVNGRFGGAAPVFPGQPNDSGWHAFFIEAALPIALNCRATLTPYVRYNGTPDGWTGDGLAPINYFAPGSGSALTNTANRNDVFYGGVSLTVDF